MPHDTPLIATIVAGIGLAFLFGAAANRLKMPPLVGYLVAGILVGPHTPGFVADQSLAPELAEMGVILLMFGVGLHCSLKDLLSVRAIAIPGAVVQIACATVLGSGLGWLLGWSIGAGLVFGVALSTASTVVLLRAMQEAGASVLGVDWRIPLGRAWEDVDFAPAIQGNLDPAALFAPQDELRRRVEAVLRQAAGRPGHIFNLGHGILPHTPVENVRAVVEWVRELTSKGDE